MTHVLDLLVAATWKGSLLLAAVLLVLALFRGRIPARWAHALLLIAVLRMLLPLAPQSPLSVFNLSLRDETRVVRVSEGPASMHETTVSLPAPTKAHRAPVWPSLVFTVWCMGIVFGAVRVLRQTTRLRHVVRSAERLAADSALVMLLDDCRAVLRVRQRVRVAISSAVDAPAVHGLVRPTLLLPASSIQSLSLEQLRFVFLHELAHVCRSDVLVHWMVTAAHALHWFNPLVWIAAARLAEERELACDALALEHLASSDRVAYGGTLLRMLDQWRLPPVPGLVGIGSRHHQLKRRIEMIARFRNESRRAVWGALMVIVAAVTLTDASAGEHRRKVVLEKSLSPEAEAVMKQLEQNVTMDLASASISDVLHAISNQTGVAITAAEGVLDAEVLAADLTLRGSNIPAHIVLFESLHSLDLAPRFDAAGVVVERQTENGQRKRVILKAPAPGTAEDVIFVREREDSAPAEGPQAMRKIEVIAEANEGDDGVVRRKVTFRGGEGGQAEGTFELEVRRDAASTAR